MIDTQIAVYVFMAAGMAIAAAVWLWQHLKKPATPPVVPVVAPVVAPSPPDDAPLCRYCGEPATRPPSRTARGVSTLDGMRVRFGAPPRYAPAIDAQLAPVLCETHGRMWDARLTRHLVVVVETERTTAEVKIADTMAAIESERLDVEMVASLTQSQREEYQRRKDAIAASTSVAS